MRCTNYQTVRRLSYFVAIAEAGSVRGGAEVLGLSVPVVSTALSELEEEFGVSLAVRTTRSFQLTTAGEAVRDAAIEVMRAAERARGIAKAGDDAPLTGALAISVTTEMATHWLPRRLAVFTARHPAVRLHVDARDDTVPLKMSSFDLAIRMRGPMNRADAHGQSFVDLTCAMPPGTLPRTTPDGWFVDLPLLSASEGAPELWGQMRKDGSACRVQFKSCLTVTNREAARRMAAEGLGAALVLAEAAAQDAQRGDLDTALPEVDFGVVCHRIVMRDALPSPEAKAFADLIREFDDSERAA